MKNKKSNTRNLGINAIVSLALLALYVITYLVSIFTSKNITFLDFFMCIATNLFILFVFRKVESLYYLPALGFAFFALFLGSMLDFYSIISIYDLLLHAASGALLTFAGHWFITMLVGKDDKVNIPLKITIWFSVLFSIASAAVWEIWEFSGDMLFGLSSQGSGQAGLVDTMSDIVAGSVSGVIGGIILFLILKRKKMPKT